jgi:hypothetical protein
VSSSIETMAEEDVVAEQPIEEEVAAGGAEVEVAEEGGELALDEEEVTGEVADLGNPADMGADADIITDSFSELKTSPEGAAEAARAWQLLITAAGSKEAVGEGLYSAFYDAAPSLIHLFVTPRAVQALRIFANLNIMVNALNQPVDLKSHVESLGFWHMSMEVTVPRTIVFRDAILDLFTAELGSKLSSLAVTALTGLLNYVAGAIVYCKLNFAGRLMILKESWAIANTQQDADADKMGDGGGKAGEDASAPGETKDEAHKGGGESKEGASEKKGGNDNAMVQNVPTTYREMFQFNAAVMGFGTALWMNEILAQFDNIVNNIANAGRLQEECSILVLRIAKVTSVKVNLAEYKSCMLASLRSLLPKDWTMQHEVAWCWLWENAEKLIVMNMGKTQGWQKELDAFYATLDEAACYQLRADVYVKFFADCPVGEGYFKQSNTYLHLIASKLMAVCAEIFVDPVKVVDDISGVGLRHVGYAIPVELFAPWVTVWIDRWRNVGASELCTEGFSWALGLVAKMQTRTITEGTTVVMKAINNNSAKAVKAAVAFAPRGERSQWMLLITVGTQDISPFLWSIQSGALDAALSILQDLLTIRADRDKYYYAAESLFKRHQDVVKILLDDAPALLPPLLDGLIWRSRIAVAGYRRVNYYLKDLLLNSEGKFHKTLEWIVQARDPKIVCHPVLVTLADLVWGRCAGRAFIYRKSWFIVTLVVFLVSQSIIKSLSGDDVTEVLRLATFLFRSFIYTASMATMIFSHVGKMVRGYRKMDTFKVLGRIPIPSYLSNWQEAANFTLMCCLLVMLATEPILHCLDQAGGEMFNTTCPASSRIKVFPYSVFTVIAMMLYYLLLIDLAVFNNRVLAYVLVCGRMLAELALFLIALASVLITLSCAFACLKQEEPEFKNIHTGFMALWEMLLSMYSTKDYDRLHNEDVILLGCYVYLILSVVFLLNLLVAQLSCAYDAIYADMVGYARLKRIRILTDSMPSVSKTRWGNFILDLALTERIEFNDGDIGLAGGVQIQELASVNPTTVDLIKRFGGSTSPSIQWPEEEGNADDDAEKFQRIEELIKKVGDAAMKNNTSVKKKHRGKNGSAQESGMSGMEMDESGAGEDDGDQGASGGEEEGQVEEE